MGIAPIPIARVTDLQRSQSASQSLQRTQVSLLQVENQLTTGLRVSAPSDDPAAAAVIQHLQKTLQQRSAYASNLTQANSQLGEVDNQLSNLETLLTQAQSTASANVGSDSTPAARKAAAAIVDSLYHQALSIGNTQFNGAYLFAGDRSTQPAFVQTATGLTFAGSSTTLQNTYDDNTLLPFQVNGAAVFGALSTGQQGATDLSPSISAQTRLIDVQGATGHGVHPGSLQISDGTGTKIVDLAAANSLGDVVDAINGAGLAVTASLSGSSLVLTGGGGASVTVSNVVGDTTATDLGIVTPSPGGGSAVIVGQGLSPTVTPLTNLSDLRAGAGIDPTGIIITNGSQSASLSFASDTTVQDLLNQLNGSSLGVRAQINAAGNGIDILNATQGTTLTIGENGGDSATQLGVRTFSATTQLSSLNGGQGLTLATSGPDLQITRRDGTSFQVSLTGASTVQDVINAINAADTGLGVTASFAVTGNGIVLTDTTAGGGTVGVSALNNSQAAAQLGLTAAASGGTLAGSDPNGVAASGILGNLAKLRDALTSNDTRGITHAAEGLKADSDRVTVMRGKSGAELQELQNRQTELSGQNTATQSMLSQLQDTDYTTAITQFQTLQTSLQAGLQTAAKALNLSLLNFLG